MCHDDVCSIQVRDLQRVAAPADGSCNACDRRAAHDQLGSHIVTFLRRRASLAAIGIISTGVPLLLAAPASAAGSLAAPTGLAPNSATVPQKDPVLTWSNVSGASGYSVEVSKSDDFSDSTVMVKLPSNGASSTNSFALPQTLEHGTYFWRVRADNSSQESAWSADGSIVKAWDDAPSTAASTPSTDATAAQTGIASYPWRFAWTPIQDASTYEIEFSVYPTFDSTSGNFNDGISNLACLTEATSFTPYSTVAVGDNGVDKCDFTKFDPNHGPVYWRVRGVDDSANALAGEGIATPLECFGWSQTKQLALPTEGAGGVAESALGNVAGVNLPDCTSTGTGTYSCNAMPEIAWQPVANANSYNVTIADDPAFTNDEHVYETSLLSLTPRDVIPDYTAGSYYVAVRACTNGDGTDASDGCTLAKVVSFTLRTPKVTLNAPTTVPGGELLSWSDLLGNYDTTATGGTAAEAENYKVEVADAADTDFENPVISTIVDASCDRTRFTCYNPSGSTTAPATDSLVVSPTASGSYIWRVVPFNVSGLADPAAVSTSAFTVDLTKPAFSFATHNGFAVTSPLTIKASEPVATPVNTSDLHVVPAGSPASAAVAGTLKLGSNNTTWIFTPTHPFATGGSYVLSVDNSVVDDNGNSAVVTGSAIRATTTAKDTSKGWTYSSGWTTHAASGALSHSYKSASAGHSASLNIAGSGVTLYGCKGPHMGTLAVTVAGHTQNVSEHQSFTRCGIPLWSKALPKGIQTLTVKVTHGTGNIDEVKVS
jgi:hypothetical protein